MTQDDDDDEISRREKVGRSGGVELVKPASPRLVSKPFARRERLTRATKRDETVCFEDLEDDAMG